MGTRSTIGIERNDGTIESVYCHWDGYPAHNGKILLTFYQDRNKIDALIEEGGMSSLGANIGEKHDFDNRKVEDQCTFYHRDRGEEKVSSHATNLEAYGCQEEYSYVFRLDSKWYVSDHREPFVLLTQELCEND